MEEINQTDNIKKTKKKRKLAIFDLYGTIAQRPGDYFSIIRDVKKEIAENFGEISDTELSEVYTELKEALQTKPSNLEKSIKLRNWTRIKLSKGLIERFKANIAWVLIYDDALEAIKYLQSKWYDIAVMSNLSKAYGEPLKNKKLFRHNPFKYKFLSYKLWFMKPDDKMFEYARKISWVDYDDMIMIGDSLKHDIEWAWKFWIKSIYVVRPKNQESDEQKTDENGNIVEYTYNETSTWTKYAQVSSLRKSILEQLKEIIL